MYYYTKVCGYLSLVHNTILLITLLRKNVLAWLKRFLSMIGKLQNNNFNCILIMVIILTFGEYILTKGTKKSLIYVWISISKKFSMKEMIQYI